ncbi:MAG: aminoglycoside phosphotransferase family protein [Bacteroidota bacterium]|nr:aminoglycoside phosphotransferase family protein [Bacteroidota bacterium]
MNLTDPHSVRILPIVEKFNITGEIATVTAFGNGHINDTFLLKNLYPENPDYLLQRINHHVFKDVPGLIGNIDRVTAYLKSKMAAGFDNKKSGQVLKLVPSKDQQLFYKDDEGNYWRIYIFVAGSRSYDSVATPQQAFEGGKAFGSFQALLSDMDPSLLSETIADFHNIQKRLADFDLAVEKDLMHLAATIETEIKFIRARERPMSVINDLGRSGLLPMRVTHNDTKFNNILFDENDQIACVIDLDTVMAGYVAYDFGDAIRTIVNTAAEDEPDLEKIQIDIPLFEAYLQGYIQEANCFLTATEIESLYLGAVLLPYMQGVRFLTDYLQGDRYFKVAYPGHNLVRAKAQFRLLQKLEEQGQLLCDMISRAAADYKSIYKEAQFGR